MAATRIVIPALLAIAVLIGGGVFAAAKVSRHPKPTATAPPSQPPTTAPPNTGPFTGTYTANYDTGTKPDGQPTEGLPPATETWGVRSVCRPGGCVATGSGRSGDTTLVSTLVFDEVGGRWLADGTGSGTCKNAPAERWEVFTLQPQPHGTLSGEYSSTTSNPACGAKRAVTFTRTADVDLSSLPDPAGQPPRVVWLAEALHGRYHETETYADGEHTGLRLRGPDGLSSHRRSVHELFPPP